MPSGLNRLKSKVNNLDTDKRKPVATLLKKLSDVADKEVV